MYSGFSGKRMLSFGPNDRFWGKNTINAAETNTGETSMAGIFDMFKGHHAGIEETSADYEALLEIIRGKVEMITDPETATMVSAELKSLTPIWDSPIIARQLLRDRLKVCNLSYDKVTGRFKSDMPEAELLEAVQDSGQTGSVKRKAKGA